MWLRHRARRKPAPRSSAASFCAEFGVYAAVTAPAMTVLLASRQSQAGGFSRNGHANRSGNSGLGGHGAVVVVAVTAAGVAG